MDTLLFFPSLATRHTNVLFYRDVVQFKLTRTRVVANIGDTEEALCVYFEFTKKNVNTAAIFRTDSTESKLFKFVQSDQ